MQARFFSIDQLNERFANEAGAAYSVYDRLISNGFKEYDLVTFDFVCVSDSREKLETLATFMRESYGYEITTVSDRQLEGVAKPFPVDRNNLLCWVLDLFIKGFQADCMLDGYGTSTDPATATQPDMDISLSEHYFNLAMEAYGQQNYGAAIIHFSTHIRIFPGNPNAWYSRAIAKDELFLLLEARADYDKAIELAPAFAEAYINRGVNKESAGEYEAALVDLNTAIGLEPDNATAFFNRGNVKFSSGDQDGACADWKQAKALGADYADEQLAAHCKK